MLRLTEIPEVSMCLFPMLISAFTLTSLLLQKCAHHIHTIPVISENPEPEHEYLLLQDMISYH